MLGCAGLLLLRFNGMLSWLLRLPRFNGMRASLPGQFCLAGGAAVDRFLPALRIVQDAGVAVLEF